MLQSFLVILIALITEYFQDKQDTGWKMHSFCAELCFADIWRKQKILRMQEFSTEKRWDFTARSGISSTTINYETPNYASNIMFSSGWKIYF